jgi:[ribosomal protein S18]-alanine N-acetyltransferase
MPPDRKPEIHIRPARPEDLTAVVEIESVSFPSPWGPDVYLPELARAEAVFLVAEVGAQVAGYVLAWWVLDEAFILKIAARPEQRRRGVASALMDALVAGLKSREVLSLSLEVRARNRPAREFYQRLGFVEMGLRRRYYSDTGEDAVTMALALKPASEGG